MSKSCKGLLKELVKCLRETECMQKVGWVCTGSRVLGGVWFGTLLHPVLLSPSPAASPNPWANQPRRQCAGRQAHPAVRPGGSPVQRPPQRLHRLQAGPDGRAEPASWKQGLLDTFTPPSYCTA